MTLVEVNHAKTKVEPDADLKFYVDDVYKHFAEKQESIACIFKEDCDLRFKKIRK